MSNIELTVTEDSPIELSVLSDSLVRLGVNEQIINSGGGGMSDDVKQALLDLIEHLAFIDADGQDYYDALYNALYPPAELDYITAVYTQSGTVYETDSLDDLKPDLVVTAHNDDGTTEVVTTYSLSGVLEAGTSVITVSYGGKTTAFNVTVTEAVHLSSITAVYTQSGTVYDTDSLDSLKADLVVTAVYSDSTTELVPSTDYTLSGTLTVGTSTVTVSYGGKTTTFTVTVSSVTGNALYYWDLTSSLVDLVSQNTATVSGATRTSSGLSLAASSDYAKFPDVIAANRRIEVDVTSINRKGSQHARLFMYNKGSLASPDVSCGFIYRMSQRYWAFYRTSWITTSFTDSTMFDGKTAIITLDSNTVMKVSCDGTDIVSSGSAINISADDNSLYIGSPSGTSAFDVIITGLRVYEVT